MPNRVRFVDPGIIVQSGGNRGGDSSISSSYALTASYAHFAVSASYAISASHEIVKEVSASYADTASYAVTASYALNAGTGGSGGQDSNWYDGGTFITSSKDVQVPGSLTVSGSLEVQSGTSRMYFESGSSVGSDDGKILIKSNGGPSNISLWRTDGVQSALLTGTGGTGFYFSNTGYFGIQPTLNPAVQTSFEGATALYMEGATGKVGINTNNPLNRFYVAGIIGTNSDIIATGSITSSGLNVEGPSNFESGSITLDTTTLPSSPGSDTKVSIGVGGSGAPQKVFQIYTNAGYLQLGPANGTYSHFQTDRPNFYFNKPIHVNGIIYSYSGNDLVLARSSGTTDTITLADQSVTFKLNNNDILFISSSELISGSAASTASFGTYIGDGSQLTNLPVQDPFPYEGDAQITGSLTVTGSLNIQGASSYENGSMTFDVTTDPISPGSNTKVNIGAGSSTSVRALKIHTNEGYLEIGPQNAAYSHFYTDRANFYFNKPIHVNGAVYGYGGDLILGRNSGTEDTITLADEKVTIKLNDTDIFIISSSHEFSGSAASTASFGTYLGDGSQLTNVTGEWDGSHDGNASISGSLTLTGSLLNTGTVSIDDTDSPYTLTGTQQFVLINPLNGDVTINLPTASAYPGRQIFFKLTQLATPDIVTLQCQGADTIDGLSTYTDLDDQFEAISIVSDGNTGWFVF